jgi:hypothetical protein
VLRDGEKRDEHQRAAGDRDDGATAHEAEPELRRQRGEEERHDERSPPQARDEERVPPLKNGSLVGDERDDRQHRERQQRDRTDLVADARVDRGNRTALRSTL